MHRAGQRLVAALCFAAAWGAPAAARAYHAGNVFDKPPGAGGGGGLFYTGSVRDKGWDCTACHVDPPERISVRLDVDPPDLYDGYRYAPGQTYTFTATLQGETAGLGSPLSNFNAIAISIVDVVGAPVGTMLGFAAEELYSGYPTTIASAGQQVGATSWTFQWVPGEPGRGPVTIHVAAVDGNGADSPPTQTLTDPFGDDVFIGHVALQEGSSAAAAPAPADRRLAAGPGLVPERAAPRQPEAAPAAPAPSAGAAACAAGVAAALAAIASRGRRRKPT